MINKKLKNEITNLISNYYDIDSNTKASIEQFVECLSDQNQFNDLQEVLEWFENRKNTYPAIVKEINLKDVRGGWHFDETTGNLQHESGGFFSVKGVKIKTKTREVKSGWEQPIVDQGTEASIQGLIRKKFNGIPHYLIEAKFEPGNYGKILFSPTLQVTFSNLNQLHGGEKPRFAEYFENPEKYKLLYEHWLPEDGGRFYLKRIKNMLVEVDENEAIEIPDGFIWLTMYQIKELLKMDNLVNPHIRSIIAHL